MANYFLTSEGKLPQVTKTDLAADLASPGTALGRSLTNPHSGLGPLHAGYATRSTQPVGVVTVGSSTTAGEGVTAAERWVNKLIAQMQTAFPSGAGTESTVGTLATARNTSPGIHGYNGGVSGMRAFNYLTDANVTQIAGLAPRAITHMIGSNDAANGVSAATYRADLVSWLNKLDAAVPGPFVHILIHQHLRSEPVVPQATWDAYRDVLADIAATRANCVFVDVSEEFKAVGVPGPDPLDVLGTDGIHINAAGHDMLFRLMARALSVPLGATAQVASSSPSTQVNILASDAFTGADTTNIAGRVFDNALGGAQARTWTCDPASAMGITGGVAGRSTATGGFFAGVQMATANYEVAATVATLIGGTAINDFWLDARRAAGGLAGTPDDYRLIVHGDGKLSVAKRVSTATAWLAQNVATAVVGDRLALRVKGTTITALKNGAAFWSGEDASITAAGWAGLSGGGATGWQVDNLTISAVL